MWRDKGTLQIGVDPRRARAVTGLGKAAAVVSLLDGSRDTAEVVRTAATYGIRQEVVHRVIELLATAGVLDDFPASLRAALPEYLRARIGPELACAALAYGHADGGAAVLARRRAAFVRVHGAGRVGACVATFLAASGVAWVSCLEPAWRRRRRSRPRALAPPTWARAGPSPSPGRCTGWHPRSARRTTRGGCPTWRCSPAGQTRCCSPRSSGTGCRTWWCTRKRRSAWSDRWSCPAARPACGAWT